MKTKDFFKLEEKIANRAFSSTYSQIERMLFALSYVGNIASIGFSFYFGYDLFYNTISDTPWVATTLSIIFLSLIELLKRELFVKFSEEIFFGKDIRTPLGIILTIFTLSVVGISFYSSMKGGVELADKNKSTKNHNTIAVDSSTKVYQVEKISLKRDFDSLDLANKELSKRKYYLDNKEVSKKYTNIDELKNTLSGEISGNKTKMLIIETKISEIDTKIAKLQDKNEDKSGARVTMIAILAFLIEMLILLGIMFKYYYQSRSYHEYKARLDTDDRLATYQLYRQIVEYCIPPDTKNSSKLPATLACVELCRINSLFVQQKQVINFYRLLGSLKLATIQGKVRYAMKNKTEILNSLEVYFNIR
jgi:hypothetical protein